MHDQPRPYILLEANYRQLLDDPPNVAILPWGATEAHNYHLPYGTDYYEASAFAARAADLARQQGAKPIVLPTIPFGNDEQQLDQVATISIRTHTAAALLRDITRSLHKQGIDRILILNGHGGNEFKPLVRDMVGEFGSLLCVVNFWQIAPQDAIDLIYHKGDHACEMETSLLLHLHPELVVMDQAGEGTKVPFEIEQLRVPGVWTPRPWRHCHPDTGSGDPSNATADKGEKMFEAVAAAIADVIVGLSAAKKGQNPYL